MSHKSFHLSLFSIVLALLLCAGGRAQSGGSGVVLVNLLPVTEEMDLALNGQSMGKMRAGAASGPLPLGPGENTITLSWGEDSKAEGKVTAKPGVTSIVVAYPDRSAAGTAVQGGEGKKAFAFSELPSGVRVAQPQFAMFSGLAAPTVLGIDDQEITFNPYVAKKVGGNSGRIKVTGGKQTLLDLDANPPACLDGPMRWYLFAVGDTETDSVKIVPVPDFKYEW